MYKVLKGPVFINSSEILNLKIKDFIEEWNNPLYLVSLNKNRKKVLISKYEQQELYDLVEELEDTNFLAELNIGY